MNTDEADRRLARIERILIGDDGYSTGIVEVVKHLRSEYEALDEKLDKIDYQIGGLVEREQHRRSHEQRVDARSEQERKDRRKFVITFVTSVVLIVFSTIASTIVQILLSVGQQ